MMKLNLPSPKIPLAHTIKLPSLPARRAEEQVTIEIGEHYVKWAVGRMHKNQMQIEGARFQYFDQANDVDISSYISTCYSDFKIRKKSAIGVIPAPLSISKNIDMPSSDAEEIKKIVNLHAGRYTPYSREEIIIDYLSMVVEGQHYTNVLLMIIHRDVAERFLRVFEVAGITLDKMVTPLEAMAGVFNRWAQPPSMNDPVWGVHIHHDTTDLTFSDRKQMVFVRNIAVGAKQIHEDPASIAAFVDELKQSLTTYHDQGVGRPIRHLLVTGVPGAVAAVKTQIKDDVMSSAALSEAQFYDMDFRERFALRENVLQYLNENPGLSFFDSFSVIEEASRLKIDLVPDDIKLRKKVREGGKDIINLGIVVMTCLLIVSLFLAAKIYLKNIKIDKLDKVFEATSEESRQLENASTKSRVLRELLEMRGRGLFVFEKFGSMIGEDIYLSGFSYDSDSSMTVKGTAGSMSRVFAFVNELEESVFFKDVEAQETKTRKEQGKEVADFIVKSYFTEPEE